MPKFQRQPACLVTQAQARKGLCRWTGLILNFLQLAGLGLVAGLTQGHQEEF